MVVLKEIHIAIIVIRRIEHDDEDVERLQQQQKTAICSKWLHPSRMTVISVLHICSWHRRTKKTSTVIWEEAHCYSAGACSWVYIGHRTGRNNRHDYVSRWHFSLCQTHFSGAARESWQSHRIDQDALYLQCVLRPARCIHFVFCPLLG